MNDKADKKKKKNTGYANPIDKDKITESPHSLPYAHTVGSMQIKPMDQGRVKGQAVSAMYEQTNMQLAQLKKQIDLLAEQARSILSRVELSEQIYQAEMRFKPLMGHSYHLYKKPNGKHVLSMIGPDEWGKQPPYEFIATAKLLSDHTWEIQNT